MQDVDRAVATMEELQQLGRSDLDRRLRHRLFQPQRAEDVSGRAAEDRQILHHGHFQRRERQSGGLRGNLARAKAQSAGSSPKASRPTIRSRSCARTTATRCRATTSASRCPRAKSRNCSHREPTASARAARFRRLIREPRGRACGRRSGARRYSRRPRLEAASAPGRRRRRRARSACRRRRPWFALASRDECRAARRPVFHPIPAPRG